MRFRGKLIGIHRNSVAFHANSAHLRMADAAA
jgi:hypothetical protein